MSKTISILGCGWLGLPTAIQLINNGFSVKGSTRSPEKIKTFRAFGIDPYVITLEKLDSVNILKFLETEILLIALPSKNVVGFQNLLSYILKSTIKKVIFISSTSVYTAKNKIITENDILEPSPLLEIENIFFKNAKIQTTIVRFAGLFGYNRKPSNFFKNGRIIPNPYGFVNMIHQDDCVEILLNIVSDEIWGEIFNACADSHPSRKEFYTKVNEDLGMEIPVFNENDTAPFKIISNKKVKEYLNFSFKYPDLLKIDYSATFI